MKIKHILWATLLSLGISHADPPNDAVAWEIPPYFTANDFYKNQLGDIENYTHEGTQGKIVPVWDVLYTKTITIPKLPGYPIFGAVCATFYDTFINISSQPNWQNMSVKNPADLTIATELAAKQIQQSAGYLNHPQFKSSCGTYGCDRYFEFQNTNEYLIGRLFYAKATWIEITDPTLGICKQVVHRSPTSFNYL